MTALYRMARVTGVVLTLIALTFSAFAASVESELGENEAKMGEEAAAEVAKEHKLSDNAEDLKRLREIGDKIAAVANKNAVEALYGVATITPFEYTFNIIEEDDINAFCVPGGKIFVYRGLLNFCQSDHELAAVLAHEITHASHHHMVYLIKKQSSLNNAMAIALLAVMIGGSRSTDISNIALGVELYQIAKLNGYGKQAERDSDHGAIYYMQAAGYNPVGLLTFLERLAKRPELVDYGIYRSHPMDAERVRAAKKLLQDLKININRRETTKAIVAEVRIDTVNGSEAPGVVIQDTLIYRPAPSGSQTAQQRAQETAEKINKALDSGLQMHQLRIDPDSAKVLVQNKPLIEVSDADAKLMEKTPAQVTNIAGNAIRNVVWKQMMDTVH